VSSRRQSELGGCGPGPIFKPRNAASQGSSSYSFFQFSTPKKMEKAMKFEIPKLPIRISTILTAILLSATSACALNEPKTDAGKGPQDTKITPLMSKEFANIAGKEGLMITVEYAPGASTAKHRHDAHTFVYVLEGAIVMQAEGGQPVTLGPGETFYETPDDVHAVSKNASTTKPAKFLVFMVKDKGAPPVVPVQ
jgi:quercetin dioxygenase-like cupin family protein